MTLRKKNTNLMAQRMMRTKTLKRILLLMMVKKSLLLKRGPMMKAMSKGQLEQYWRPLQRI